MSRLGFPLLIILLIWGCHQKPPIEVGYVESLGDSIYYKAVGVGEPLLIIHGGPVLDHQYLYEHLLPLSDSYQLIFYDQRACGKSQAEIDAADMTFAAMSADIEVLRRYFGHDKIFILGHSWGGLVAMNYAIEYEDHVNKLILSNSMAPTADYWSQENVEIASRYTPQDQEQLDKLSTSGLIRSKDAAPYIEQMMMISFKPQFYEVDKMERLKLHIAEDYHLRSSVFMGIAPELANYDLIDSLSSVKSETLIIYGETEPAAQLFLDEFVTAFPSARAEVIGQSGHFPFIEQPQRFLETVRDFLK